MTLTFIDAGVLIAASRGGTEQATRALAVLGDPTRTFAASAFLRLEVLPQASFNRRHAELAFYEAFFAAVSVWATDWPRIVDLALREASTFGVEAMDALHVRGRRRRTCDHREAHALDPPRACGPCHHHPPAVLKAGAAKPARPARHGARANYGAAAIDNPESRRRTMRGFKIPLDQVLRRARERVADLAARRQHLPTRVEVRDRSAAAVVKLATKRKHLTDLVKVVAYQAESDLLVWLAPHYPRANDEGRTLLHELFATAGALQQARSAGRRRGLPRRSGVLCLGHESSGVRRRPRDHAADRGGTGVRAGGDGHLREYPWGNEPPTPVRAVFDPSSSTAPVGGRPAGATPLGVHDLAGNVWEWCLNVGTNELPGGPDPLVWEPPETRLPARCGAGPGSSAPGTCVPRSGSGSSPAPRSRSSGSAWSVAVPASTLDACHLILGVLLPLPCRSSVVVRGAERNPVARAPRLRRPVGERHRRGRAGGAARRVVRRRDAAAVTVAPALLDTDVSRLS